MRKKEIRCQDCDYVLIDKEGNYTDVALVLECKDNLKKGTEAVICKKCGTISFIKNGLDILETEDLSPIEYIIVVGEVRDILSEKNLYIEDIVKEFNKNEQTSKENSFKKEKDKTIDFEQLFNSIKRPEVPLKSIPDADGDSLLSYKYILLSKGHDSWKIFDNKEELLKELSVINNLEEVLIYSLGKEHKVKKELNLA